MSRRSGRKDVQSAKAELPKSVLSISDDKKADVLVELGGMCQRF